MQSFLLEAHDDGEFDPVNLSWPFGGHTGFADREAHIYDVGRDSADVINHLWLISSFALCKHLSQAEKLI